MCPLKLHYETTRAGAILAVYINNGRHPWSLNSCLLLLQADLQFYIIGEGPTRKRARDMSQYIQTILNGWSWSHFNSKGFCLLIYCAYPNGLRWGEKLRDSCEALYQQQLQTKYNINKNINYINICRHHTYPCGWLGVDVVRLLV